MTGKHARAIYLVNDAEKKLCRLKSDGSLEAIGEVPLLNTTPSTETFAYSALFGAARPDDAVPRDVLSELGQAMMSGPKPPDIDSNIPAGYTYFGQFVFHDITYLTPNGALNGRSPSLDLDSVLPEQDGEKYMSKDEPLGPLAIGRTSGGGPMPGDLPREINDVCPGKPIIADDRNDNFLPLAQCHLALLLFYNAIARWYGYGSQPDVAGDPIGPATRDLWVRHFQWVVLYDYLGRIIDPATHASVLKNGRIKVHPKSFRDNARPSRLVPGGDRNWMPLEFAAAIGRFGHSMIRNEYRPWNASFADPASPAVTLTDFLRLSYRNSGDELGSVGRALPRRWLTDWFGLFDFGETNYAHVARPPMMANKIDTRLAWLLGQLPAGLVDDPPGNQPTFNLAEQTLLRGHSFNLVSAQEAIGQLNRGAPDPAIPLLEPDQLVEGENDAVRDVFQRHRDLSRRTPLWFYVLKEAQVIGKGNRLGPFASRVVMEIVHASIEASDISILDGSGWKPILPGGRPDNFSAADLIAFSGNPDYLGTTHI